MTETDGDVTTFYPIALDGDTPSECPECGLDVDLDPRDDIGWVHEDSVGDGVGGHAVYGCPNGCNIEVIVHF